MIFPSSGLDRYITAYLPISKYSLSDLFGFQVNFLIIPNTPVCLHLKIFLDYMPKEERKIILNSRNMKYIFSL